jgi:hypothetical protein
MYLSEPPAKVARRVARTCQDVDALSQLTRYEERNSADPHLDKAERWIDKGNRHRAQWRGSSQRLCKETEHRRASARANLHTRAIENDLCCSFAAPVKISERIVTCVLDHICFHGLITLALVPYFYLIGSSLNYSRFEITFA